MSDLTPDMIHIALDRARNEMLDAAASMVEARAALYRAHKQDPGGILHAKAEEAQDIAKALRALRAGS